MRARPAFPMRWVRPPLRNLPFLAALRAAAVVLAALLAACGAGTAAIEVRVSAASSLADAMTELKMAFETAHPEVEVLLNMAGSPLLREQVLSGAPADVLAVADWESIQPVVDAGLSVVHPEVFARNRMQIVVPSGNPAGVTGPSDLGRPDLIVGLCAAGVPCGDLARQVLALAGVVASPDTEEPNVRSLLTKIEEGELDVAIVYTTDVEAAAGKVEGIVIPAEFEVLAEYPIAALSPGGRPFFEFVLSSEGQTILGRHGFIAP